MLLALLYQVSRKVSYRSNLDYMVCMKENHTHLGMYISIGSIYLLFVFVSGVDDTMDTTVSAA